MFSCRSPPSPLTLSAPFFSSTTTGGNGRHHLLLLPSRVWKNPNLMASTGSGGGRRGWTVRCMAHERRVKMVAKQIQRELSDMLLTDKILQHAVLPESFLGADRYLSSVTTISDVEVSRDLQVVKVFVSVFGDDRGREVAIAGLKSKAKYVRSQLGKRMRLRLTPEIRFIEDESLERGSRVLAILDRLKEEREKSGGQDVGDWEEDDQDGDEEDGDGEEDDQDGDEEDGDGEEDDQDGDEEDGDGEKDDQDEGIIYIK